MPVNAQGRNLKVSQFFGENVFQLKDNRNFSPSTQEEVKKILNGEKILTKVVAKEIADVVLDWALDKGATHFCHWFQPLTGSTAEKHDSFLTYDGDRAIEKLSASQLIQGEPDASSFPNGGTRSTFEARGYTSWDLTSPIFIKEGINGKTLCIPTAFISYHGNALDVKTPLLRSLTTLNKYATEFAHLTGFKDVKRVIATCGYEQEYFLIDKSFYFQREDLVMSGRTLLGSLTTRNQQLEDHYFGTIPERVLAFMQDLETELYRVGIPAKTRHNEVAPGQFEIAPIFRDANTATDNNQLLMAILKSTAERHDFVCLFHEKPFAGINGSGKHLNWSMADDQENNFLEPGNTPHENHRFLAMVSIVCEALKRHSVALRAAIASNSNDHRLGANEAPPSIISAFLGDTITSILEKLASGEAYTPEEAAILDTGAEQLAQLLKDNTDRNRTSPFAFTGNKFEFRAVGSNANIGVPLAILNTAVADVLKDSNEYLKEQMANGVDTPSALTALTKKWYANSRQVVFNGDGYSQEWLEEAAKRGLPNLKTTVDALTTFIKKENHEFLVKYGVYKETELQTLYNVWLERYNKHRDIEFRTQKKMIDRYVIPAALRYKRELATLIESAKAFGSAPGCEKTIYDTIEQLTNEVKDQSDTLVQELNKLEAKPETDAAVEISTVLLSRCEKVAELAGAIEDIVPDSIWEIPTYYDLLFVR